ncbi:unnamed protein product, partial [Prorocentrum cordatum]
PTHLQQGCRGGQERSQATHQNSEEGVHPLGALRNGRQREDGPRSRQGGRAQPPGGHSGARGQGGHTPAAVGGPAQGGVAAQVDERRPEGRADPGAAQPAHHRLHHPAPQAACRTGHGGAGAHGVRAVLAELRGSSRLALAVLRSFGAPARKEAGDRRRAPDGPYAHALPYLERRQEAHHFHLEQSGRRFLGHGGGRTIDPPRGDAQADESSGGSADGLPRGRDLRQRSQLLRQHRPRPVAREGQRPALPSAAVDHGHPDVPRPEGGTVSSQSTVPGRSSLAARGRQEAGDGLGRARRKTGAPRLREALHPNLQQDGSGGPGPGPPEKDRQHTRQPGHPEQAARGGPRLRCGRRARQAAQTPNARGWSGDGQASLWQAHRPGQDGRHGRGEG